MIPLSTTWVSVLRIKSDDEYEDPYTGAGEPEREVVYTDIRAVIDFPGGNLDLAGGQQNVTDYGLKCDPVVLRNSDWIKDLISERTFRIIWYMAFPEHVEARLRDTEGEV